MNLLNLKYLNPENSLYCAVDQLVQIFQHRNNFERYESFFGISRYDALILADT